MFLTFRLLDGMFFRESFNSQVLFMISYKEVVIRGGSRATAASKMECFVIINNGFQPLIIITKRSILDVAAALDPPLVIGNWNQIQKIQWRLIFFLNIFLKSSESDGGNKMYFSNASVSLQHLKIKKFNKEIIRYLLLSYAWRFLLISKKLKYRIQTICSWKLLLELILWTNFKIF